MSAAALAATTGGSAAGASAGASAVTSAGGSARRSSRSRRPQVEEEELQEEKCRFRSWCIISRSSSGATGEHLQQQQELLHQGAGGGVGAAEEQGQYWGCRIRRSRNSGHWSRWFISRQQLRQERAVSAATTGGSTGVGFCRISGGYFCRRFCGWRRRQPH